MQAGIDTACATEGPGTGQLVMGVEEARRGDMPESGGGVGVR